MLSSRRENSAPPIPALKGGVTANIAFQASCVFQTRDVNCFQQLRIYESELLDFDGLAAELGGFRGGESGGDGARTFVDVGLDGRVVDDALHEVRDFGGDVVVGDVDGHGREVEPAGHELPRADLDVGARVVANDGPFRAVEAGTHRVGTNTSNGDENFADDVVGKLVDGDCAVVYGPIGKALVIGESGDFGCFASDPTEQIDGMAAATDERFAPRVDTPVVDAFRTVVIVRVFAFHKVQFTDGALFDETFGEREARSVTANLPDHEFHFRFFDFRDNLLGFRKIKRQRLFAEDMLARADGGDAVFGMEKVRGGNGDYVDVRIVDDVAVVRGGLRDVEFGLLGVQTCFIDIANSRQFAVWMVSVADTMATAHAQTDNAGLVFTVFHVRSLSCFYIIMVTDGYFLLILNVWFFSGWLPRRFQTVNATWLTSVVLFSGTVNSRVNVAVLPGAMFPK